MTEQETEKHITKLAEENLRNMWQVLQTMSTAALFKFAFKLGYKIATAQQQVLTEQLRNK